MTRGSFAGSRRGRGSSRYGYRGNGSFRGGRGRGRGRGGAPAETQPQREDDGTQLAERFEQVRISDDVDEKLGFARIQEGTRREGWLINMHPVGVYILLADLFLSQYVQTLVKDADWQSGKAAVDFYFVQDDGGMFKCTYQYEPYFYIACKVRVRIFSAVLMDSISDIDRNGDHH